jgi:PKD repeat protein
MNNIAKASLAVIFITILLAIFVQTGWRYGADRTFYVASEKGTVDMKINRTELFSNCIFDDLAEANSSTYLYEGWHNFVVWYHHTTGNASFVLSWANSTMSKQVVPDKNMRTSRTELASLPLNAFFSYKIPGFSTNASFTDLSLGDNITEWRWNFGDGTPDEIYNAPTNPTHTYDRAGVYNVTLTVVNGTGGMNTHSELVDVYMKGDVNHDRKLSAADAVLILQMAACGINTDPAADVNSDGVITSLDALMVSQAVMKGVSNE